VRKNVQTELYHDQERKLLIYHTDAKSVDQVMATVPEAREVNGAYVACPASLKNIQLLRLIPMPVPGIMQASGYDYPIQAGRKPLAHQKVMANFMVSHPRSFNLSDMGTMKTLATLWAADFLMQQEGGRALIVAPLSILQRVWGDAIFANFLGKRTYQIVHGDSRARQKSLAVPADFYIINHDGLGVGAHTRGRFELDGLSKDIALRHDIKLVIVDEASAYRDASTKRHRIARLLFVDRPYLWLLTGTPTSNGPVDAYGLARLVNGAFGESYTSFHNRTMIQLSQFKWLPRAGSYNEARKLLTPAIRYDLHDVWDGPPITTQQRQVDLTKAQRKAMHELKRDLQITVHSGAQITALNEAAARLKFIQISLGAIYDSDHDVHTIDAAPRLKALREIIDETPHKILCFVPLTSVVNLLYRELKDRIGCAVVNGETSARDRASIFERFQQPESDLRLLIADPGTMAHGLDLFAANVVVWFGPTDRTELYLQAIRRAYRPGQKHPVSVIQIVATQLEREIYARLENNASLQGIMLKAVKDNML
jgi:SNF2 family DNA or RNA helicase